MDKHLDSLMENYMGNFDDDRFESMAFGAVLSAYGGFFVFGAVGTLITVVKVGFFAALLAGPSCAVLGAFLSALVWLAAFWTSGYIRSRPIRPKPNVPESGKPTGV